MTKEHPGDNARSTFLERCAQLEEHASAMRNHAMKPGNAWLARGELAKLMQLSSELEHLLEDIKQADRP